MIWRKEHILNISVLERAPISTDFVIYIVIIILIFNHFLDHDSNSGSSERRQGLYEVRTDLECVHFFFVTERRKSVEVQNGRCRVNQAANESNS